jgi:hypothetical protein
MGCFYYIMFIAVGAAIGFGLKHLGHVGQIIFWCIIGYCVFWAIIILSVIIGEYIQVKWDKTPYKMPYGHLTEYGGTLTFIACGVIASYWLGPPWTVGDAILILGLLGLLFGTIMIVAKGFKESLASRNKY